MCKYLFETLLSVLLDHYPEVVILAMAQTVKNLPTVLRPGFDPLGKSPGEGNGDAFQYSYLENSMDTGASQLQSMESQGVGHD